MKNYYSEKLTAERLKQVYEIAPPRVKKYFEAEVNYILQNIHPDNLVLELGCGYGRILPPLAKAARTVIGIDTSFSSLSLGKELRVTNSNYFFAQMNAIQLAFQDSVFDAVICIQNGISAFHVNPIDLIQESIRVTKKGGIILFSSYSANFWNDRLEWFQQQSTSGLLGEIDFEKTCDGIIVCKDGFTATTVSPDQFIKLTAGIENINMKTMEIDESSVFCEILKR